MEDTKKTKDGPWYLSPLEYIKTYIRNKMGRKYLEEVIESKDKTNEKPNKKKDNLWINI